MANTENSNGECDGASVGVLVTRGPDHVLVGTRSDGGGVAPPAGHVFDVQTSYEDAAVTEVAEETGLAVVVHTLKYAVGGYRANRCGRGDSSKGPGHQWRVYTCRATGSPRSGDGRLFDLHWATRGELAVLIARTAARARGHVTDVEWRTDPGLEPVWCAWAVQAGFTSAPPEDLVLIDAYLRA